MHLIDYKLGGSSDLVENLAVVYSGVNTRFNIQVEQPVQIALAAGDCIQYSVTVAYAPNSLLPVGFTVSAVSDPPPYGLGMINIHQSYRNCANRPDGHLGCV